MSEKIGEFLVRIGVMEFHQESYLGKQEEYTQAGTVG